MFYLNYCFIIPEKPHEGKALVTYLLLLLLLLVVVVVLLHYSLNIILYCLPNNIVSAVLTLLGLPR